MKHISIYLKDTYYDPASYYRIIQYFNDLNSDKYNIKYRIQLKKKEYEKFMPISKQTLVIKIYFELLFCIRTFFYLLSDLFFRKDYLILSRRFVNRIMPFVFKILLSLILKRGTKLYWDFDDHIIESREVTRSIFDYLSDKATAIIVTHDFLKNLVLNCYKDKVFILPTTDGEVYKKLTDSNTRLESLCNEIRIIWLGTSVNLQFVKPIIPVLDKFANELSKKVILSIVSNEELSVKTNNLIIENVKWSREIATEYILKSHIGIMPLIDSEFVKGKGGFKLIQYMSGALPVIGSNVGFNKDVIDSSCGFLLDDMYEYSQLKNAVFSLSDLKSWTTYSENALKNYELRFSYIKNLIFWKELLER